MLARFVKRERAREREREREDLAPSVAEAHLPAMFRFLTASLLILLTLTAVFVFLGEPAHAQEYTTLVSNISTGSFISFFGRQYFTQSFTINSDENVRVASVILAFNSVPSGANVEVSLHRPHSNDSSRPGGRVTAFTLSGSLSTGSNTFTANNRAVLAAGTYFIRVHSSTSSLRLRAGSDGETGTEDDWSIANSSRFSTNGRDWTDWANSFGFAISGAVDIPSTGAPTIGDVVGHRLTALTSDIVDLNGLTGVSYEYQWIRVDGSEEIDITGATSSTYTLSADDDGKKIKVRVRFTDDTGFENELTSVAFPSGDALVEFVPLTASLRQTGQIIDAEGEMRYTARLTLSEKMWMPWRTMKEDAFEVAGGVIVSAKRFRKEKMEVYGGTKSVTAEWKLEVKPNEPNGTVTLTLAGNRTCSESGIRSGAICATDGRPLNETATIELVPQEPELSVSIADATADEERGVLHFTVTLSRSSGKVHKVVVRTTDAGSARAGINFHASGDVPMLFGPRETSKVVGVKIIDDAINNSGKTVVMEITEAYELGLFSGNRHPIYIKTPTATGTITNDDPLPKAWLARFGRTVGTHVTDAISTRLRTDQGETHLTIGGQKLGQSETMAGFANLFGVQSGQAPTVDLRQLLLGSSFRLNMGAGGGDSSSPHLTAWGRFAGTTFNGQDGDLDLDGDVFTGTVGVDGTWDRLLVGLAVAHTRGDGTYGGKEDTGDLENSLTSLHPYVRYAVTDRLDIWGSIGYGWGETELVQDNGGRYETDTQFMMGAVGGRGVVLSSGTFQLATRTDAMFTNTSSDAVQGMDAADADAHRVRVVLEGSQGITWADGRSLTPTMEVGVRHDWGDAETGFGLEVGGRVHYADPRLGLTVEASIRGLVAHEDDDYDEWGASGTVRLAPGVGGHGLSLTLSPTWGVAASGVDALWSQQTATGLGAGARQAGRVNAEMGYGFAAFDAGLLTPYAGTILADGADRTYQVGTRWASVTGLTLNLEGTRQEPVGPQPVNQGVRLQVQWGF